MSTSNKINLALLKKLVVEFENVLTIAENIRNDANGKIDCHIELNKACGLAMGISSEAYLLASDIQVLLRGTSVPAADKHDLVSALFPSGLKGSGNTN